MKLPRFFSARLIPALALGCALLAFAPLPGAHAQDHVKVVALNNAGFERMAKFIETVNADPASKAAMEEMGKDQELGVAVMSGGSVNDTINAKFPKAAAVFKSGGYTPDEFNAVSCPWRWLRRV